MATVELVNMAMVPDYRPYWLPDDVTDYGQMTGALYELGNCMQYNPAPFQFVDIESAVATKVEREGEIDTLGDGDWEWEVALKDGRRFFVHGWHDYTGWDCQSGAEYQEEDRGE